MRRFLMTITRARNHIRLFYLVTVVLIILLIFNSTFLITNLSFTTSFRSSEDPEHLKDKLLDLGQRYVLSLSEQQVNVQDGPYSGHNTNYDLKKSLAVLLENILGRLHKLEILMGFLNSSSFADGQSVINARALLAGAQEECRLHKSWNATHPHCEEKIKWMDAFWKGDPCYANNGVDGSHCSFIIYLSEVEKFCPRLPWRPTLSPTSVPLIKQAKPNFDLKGLFDLMKDNPTNFQWIKMRLERLWPKWIQGFKNLASRQNYTLNKRVRRKIFLHLGLLTKESGFKFGEKSLKGGPLGELVQWSDLMASLYILGHELIISSEINTFKTYAQADETFKSSCPVLNDAHRLDIIFTDIVGMKQIKKKIPASLQNYKCRLRVLDSFGTHAEFNDLAYFNSHKDKLGGIKSKNPWGGHTLNLQQFYTMYPHTPDNTFLGFIVETFENVSSIEDANLLKRPQKENWALVYGKEMYMWKNSEDYIKAISEHLEVHATVADDDKSSLDLPEFVVNHGVLSGRDLHALLKKTKVFVGLGFPYEGPAPLEAVANGVLFLNPKFEPPKGRLTDSFFAEKPTLRQLTSQNPYAEDFIGEPHVLTIDIKNLTSVRQAVTKAKGSEIEPFLPFEFTHEGMLERVNVLVTHQDFCVSPADRNWPPFSASRLILSEFNQSCKDACWKQGLICERSYFPKVNNVENLLRFSTCEITDYVKEVHAPSFGATSATCYLQQDNLLYSCASKSVDHRRICPCRDFIKDQSAVCAACL